MAVLSRLSERFLGFPKRKTLSTRHRRCYATSWSTAIEANRRVRK